MTRRVLIQTDHYRVTYVRRSAAEGRFGGGWQWALGIQIGARTVLVNLLVCSIRIGPRPRCEMAVYMPGTTTLAECELPAGHTGQHKDGEFVWGSRLHNPRRK